MLVDAHAHLDRYDLLGDQALESALAEIERHGILTVSNSMDLPAYERNVEIGALCGRVLPVFGVHPWNAPAYAGRLKDLDAAVDRSPMLGEIGLDHHFVKDASAYPAQREVFEYFLSKARRQNKIVIVHSKGAERDVLDLLERYDVSRAIIHWYSGPLDVFRRLAGRKAYFSVGLEVLHSEHIKTIVREIPVNRLLTETDNPGGPQGFLGRPGNPALLLEIVSALAAVRETTPQAIVGAVESNLMDLVRDDPRLTIIRDALTRNPAPRSAS